ncbi:hypothetical protein PENTCL1PPCAC_13070 [Pristionchus entomophagus]|uniref:Uncharacterized protein n=1 Tax=Pristionchus entomophagus TaxID=358040 RepID=A0AAV5T702_9BILA|nr:hypothetical protein PENTCL1PPCAC_13070 [Pristionchus entomophagus]
MPLRSSSRHSHPTVSRSKSDYGSRSAKDTVPASTVPCSTTFDRHYPSLRHHNIDYIDECSRDTVSGGGYRNPAIDRGGGGGGRTMGSEMEDCCTSSDGDTTMPSTMMGNSTMNTTSSDFYGIYHDDDVRLNATALGCPEGMTGYRNPVERRYRTRSSSRPLFEGETSMGYGMDYRHPQSFYDYRTVPKTPSRSARVREVLLDLLLLGGRSRRRERKEKKRASSVAPGAGGGVPSGSTPRATSLKPHREEPLRQHTTPLADANERRREVTWLDERRQRRRRRSSLERYGSHHHSVRTPSVDTALSPPYGRDTVGLPYPCHHYHQQHHHQQCPEYEMDNSSRRWRSGEELRGRLQWGYGSHHHEHHLEQDEPRRKKKREVVRIWETPRPQCVRIVGAESAAPRTTSLKAHHTMESDCGRREKRRMGRKDAFVNSHEWTLSRQVSELHLGIIGQPNSGKTALVHRYLTQVYQSEESPEGGRFKKEVTLEGHSHLLLIRDEGNAPPDSQFTLWADAILFVFAVDSWETYVGLEHLYQRMCDYRSLQEMPVILVGTKDTVSESSPRVVTEEQGKRMAHKFGRCAYYETNAGHGLNVEKVFKEACLKMFSSRRLSLGGYRTPTPTEKYATDSRMYGAGSSSARGVSSSSSSAAAGPYPTIGGTVAPSHHRSVSAMPGGKTGPYANAGRTHSSAIPFTGPSSSFASRAASQMDAHHSHHRGVSPSTSQKSINSVSNGAVYSRSTAAMYDGGYYGGGAPSTAISSVSSMGAGMEASSVSTSHLPTPSSTPTTQRKNRRISNIFQRPSKGSSSDQHHNSHHSHEEKMRDVGQGRAIPIMQGQLYKRSGGKSALNRGEWKKKFVTLTNDGKLTYHQSLKEYMDNGQGKEVFLGLAAVRLPGRQRMRNSQAASTLLEGTETTGGGGEGLQRTPRESSGGGGMQGPVASGEGTSGGGSDDGASGLPSSATTSRASIPITPQTVANSKKRRGYSRKTGGGKGNEEDEECFEIVTCDAKRWEFCASSAEEREEWVKAIEGQIDAALQKQTSAPSSQTRVLGARNEVTAILSVAGNEVCADCAAARPEWASLNLGTAICMECSGVHRNLGSHISKVRSLKFDEWPVEYLSVMRAIGNTTANGLWEARLREEDRPLADASPDERESFIRAKYVEKRWLAPLEDERTPIGMQLIGAVLSGSVPSVCSLLSRASSPSDVNATVSATDRRSVLHLACSTGRVEVVQLLLWNGASVRALDHEGRSALWHARNGDAAECAAVLIAAGLEKDYGITDQQQKENSQQRGQQPPQLHESQVILGSLSSRDYSDSTRRLTSVGNA